MKDDFYAPGNFLKIHYVFKKVAHPKWGHLKIFVDWVPRSVAIPALNERTFYVLPFEINTGTQEFAGPMNGATCRLCKDEVRHILVKQSDILVVINQWRLEDSPNDSDAQRRSFYHLVGPL